MHIDKYDEDYLITMPKIHIEGIMSAALCPELSGTSYIRSSTGYTTKIEYASSGWIRGKKNSFVATVFRDDNEKEPLYIAEGQWSGEFTIKNVNTQEVVETLNTDSDTKRIPLSIAPIEDQHPLESRRAWQPVVEAIHKGDIFAIGHEKSKIEIEQREMRKREKAEGREFPRRFFSRIQRDPVAETLAQGLNPNASLATVMGGHQEIWLWDEEKYRKTEIGRFDRIRSPARTRFDSGVGGILLDAEKFNKEA